MNKIYWKALFPAFVFLLMQVVFSFLVPLVMLVCHPSAMKDIVAKGPASIDHSAFVSPASMAIAIMLAGLSTCYILWRKGMVRLPEAFDGRSIRWPLTFLGILGVILGVIATDLLSEQLNLPNIIEAEMTEIVGTFWGVLAVAVIGPIVEEVVFREGIQGCLLRGGVKPWTAAVVSALCFGIIHLNPAQVPFAFIVGLMLAVIYQKTGNVVITSLLHILNNSVSVALMRVLGDGAEDFTLTEWYDLTPLTVWCPIVILGFLSVWSLCLFYKKYQ